MTIHLTISYGDIAKCKVLKIEIMVSLSKETLKKWENIVLTNVKVLYLTK